MVITKQVNWSRRASWLGWIVLAGLTAWLVTDWLRTLVFAIKSWGLPAGLVDGVAALRLAEVLILVPLAAYLLVMRRDFGFLSKARWLMVAGSLLAGLAFLGLKGRIDWAILALGFAFLGLLAAAFASLRTGCAARLVPPLALVGLILLALLVNLGGYLLHGYPVIPYPAPHPPAAESAEERRQQDVRYLGSELARLHKNVYHATPQQVYWDELARLEAQAPALDEIVFSLEMMRFVAAIGDGHTSFRVQKPSPFHALPVDFQWYGNDLHVRGVSPAYRQALGARVLEIGNLPIEQLYQAVLPYIAHENDAGARVQSRYYLNLVDLLVEVGAVAEVGPVRVVVETSAQETLELEILPLEPGQKVDYLFAGKAQPYYLSQPDLPFWYEYRPQTRTLYFRYAACVDPLGFRKMSNEIWDLIDSQPVERLIIDLRGNGGGNTLQFDRFFLPKLNEHPEFNDPEQLFVLIDRVTFSSAKDHAADFKERTQATLVGEPTGGRPNAYGEVRSFKLPNSGARIYYSTSYFQTMQSDPPSVEPDVLIYAPAEAVFNGQDPVLEYIVPQESWD